MLVDTVTFLQGFINAAEKSDLITTDECQRICIRVNGISRPGSSGRSVCSYYELVRKVLALLDFRPVVLARLWQHHIGESLAFGIGTAAANREEQANDQPQV